MDPSYSPYTGSQFGATPGAGGFSGVQSGAGFGSGAGTVMQPGFRRKVKETFDYRAYCICFACDCWGYCGCGGDEYEPKKDGRGRVCISI